jgi:predicted O-linked N-acetylglucosamine transferase (SPINDLY family)
MSGDLQGGAAAPATAAAAIALWRSGRAQEAEWACEALLTGRGEDPEVIALLAEIYGATSRPALAGRSLERLAALHPGDAAMHRRLGDAWLAAGQPDAAVSAFERALEIEPASARAHNNLGRALLRLARPADALRHYERALALRPDYAIAYNNRGLALVELGRPLEALESYRRASERERGFWQAHCNAGNALARVERLADAVESYTRAIELQPDATEALLGRAFVRQRLHRFEAALADFEQVLALHPADALALAHKASVLLDLRRADEALGCADRALALQPQLAQAHHVRGRALRALHRYEEARAACERATELEPDWGLAWFHRASLLDDLCELDAARECYRRALAVDAGLLSARLRLLTSHIPIIPESDEEIVRSRDALVEELSRFEAWLRAGAVADGDAAELVDQFFYLTYQEYCNRGLLERYRAECVQLMSRWQGARAVAPPPAPAVAPPLAAVPGRRLRIAIVSAHLVDHSVYKAIVQGWLRCMDRTRFEFHLFHVGGYRDAQTSAAAALSDRFTGGPRSLEEWVTAVGESRPDVLVFPEVGMHTATLRLAALRLAPRQLAAWGHPETTGLPTIDCYLSAEAFEPPGAQDHYSERLVTLPRLGCFYEPYGVESVAASAEPGLAGEGPLFICPGVPFKYAPQHDGVLVDIARRLGRCRFVFFRYPSTTASARLEERLARAFERAGLVPEPYLRFIPWQPRAQFFALLRQADACLDTIGFSGFNTAMQAVECELPVVAYRARYMRGRFASGILDCMELPELVAEDRMAYVETAVRVATDEAGRARLRAELRARQARVFADRAPIAAFERFLLEHPAP